MSAPSGSANHDELEPGAARTLDRRWESLLTVWLAAAAAYHLWYVGVVGTLPEYTLNGTHLALLMPVAFIIFAAARTSPQSRPSLVDLGFVILTFVVTLYVVVSQEVLELRLPTVTDVTTTEVVLGTIAVVVVTEATRRVIGLGMALCVVAALLYLLFGSQLPGRLGFRTMGYDRVIEAVYLGAGEDGIFGSLTGISANELIMFTLFGSFLTRTGIGKWFAQLSAAVGGTWTGGSAKVAVIYSGLFGSVSGSPTADLYASGVYTIPLMKRSGFSASYAAGVAAASATGAQIMPPLMGASVFIMATIIGMSYSSIIVSALVPALIFFFAKGSAAHFQARRDGVSSLPPEEIPPLRQTLSGVYFLIPIVVLIGALLAGYSPIRSVLFGTLAAILISFVGDSVRQTPLEIVRTLADGARNCIIIAVPCAAAGIMTAALTITGLGLAFSGLLIGLSGGNLFLSLVLSAITALLLGTGLPTTPAYILTAIVVTPGLTSQGIPPLAAHMFVLYFAVISTITPPVGITAYAAAGIAKAPPNAAGWQAFKVAIPGFVLPFVFAYHPALLLIGDFSVIEFLVILSLTIASTIGVSAGLAGFFLVPLGFAQRAILTVCSCLLVAPNPWIMGGAAAILAALYAFLFARRQAAHARAALP